MIKQLLTESKRQKLESLLLLLGEMSIKIDQHVITESNFSSSGKTRILGWKILRPLVVVKPTLSKMVSLHKEIQYLPIYEN